jgi:omega-6 fatty acid desaturase (delta-12 desaturase)
MSMGTVPYAWPSWYGAMTRFRKSDPGKAVWQLINTFVPYFLLWYLMIRTIQLGYPYAVTLMLGLAASAFLVRIFIVFHDCSHDSFFAGKRANTILGYVAGVFVFTPLEDWRYAHLHHHGTYANLDARGSGDIWLMTVSEYQQASVWQRWLYRSYRNPFVLFVAGPLFHFGLRQRFPTWHTGRAERRSVLVTDLAIVAIVLVAASTIGWRTYLMIQLPVLWIAGAAGVWLFYVQHQFEGVYWVRGKQWDPLRAAWEGSSFYALPSVLRWFSGNIGYHFVHHLQSRIPNYHLKACYDAIPELHAKAPLTVGKSLATPALKLWDERRQRLVGFPSAKRSDEAPPA